jgi:hypothetical protein
MVERREDLGHAIVLNSSMVCVGSGDFHRRAALAV